MARIVMETPGEQPLISMLEITVTLGHLSSHIGHMTQKQQVVLRSYSQSVPHEGTGIDDHGCRELRRDTEKYLA